jgi:hypothetical protein
MKRFFAVFALIVLYMVGWAPILLVFILALEGDDEAILIIIGCVLPVIIGLFLPYLNFVCRKVYRYRGEGVPIPEKELRARILKINELDQPVMVVSRKKKLLVTWNYAEERWRGVLSAGGMKKAYHLQIKFNARKKEVILTDILKSFSWRAGPGGARVRGGFFRGIDIDFEAGRTVVIDEYFPGRGTDSYHFSSREIKDPVSNTILKSGWDIRLAMW